jgi:hypothetical protein
MIAGLFRAIDRGSVYCGGKFSKSSIYSNFSFQIPTTTDQQKIDLIKKYNGSVHPCDISKQFIEAEEEARKNNGFYMNQFANANHAEVGVISLIQASLEFILGVP